MNKLNKIFSIEFINNKLLIRLFKIKITFKFILKAEIIYKLKSFLYSLKKINIKQQDKPIITVIITSYKNYKITLNLIKSINYFKPKVPFEIIIADDCSPDNTLLKLSKIKSIKVVQPKINCGFGDNVKNAIKHANGKYYF